MIALHLKKLPLTREVSLLILAYLYLPIFVLIAYSFNANRSASNASNIASGSWNKVAVMPPSVKSCLATAARINWRKFTAPTRKSGC